MSQYISKNSSQFFRHAKVTPSEHTDAPTYYYQRNQKEGPLCIYEFKISGFPNVNMYIFYLPSKQELFFLAGNAVVEEQNLFLLTMLEWFSIFDDIYVMHSSSVEYKSKTIAFVGTSGAGKTSLSLQFTQLGGRILSDDQVVILPSSEVVPIRNPILGLDIGTICHFGLGDKILHPELWHKFNRYTPKELYAIESFEKLRVSADYILPEYAYGGSCSHSIYRELSAVFFPRIDVNTTKPSVKLTADPKQKLFQFLKPWITYHQTDFEIPDIDKRILRFLDTLIDVKEVRVFDLDYGVDLDCAGNAIRNVLEV